MDKMKLAHDAALAMIKSGCSLHTAIADAWRYADAMQAEADKRKPSGLPDALCEAVCMDIQGNWQPDWSQAPDDATAWEYLGHGTARWHTTKKGTFRGADLFGYSGVDMLLVERPE